MCGGGSVPRPAPQLPEAPTPPPEGQQRKRDGNRRRRAATGGSGTILTSSAGVTSNAPTAQKTLLGS